MLGSQPERLKDKVNLELGGFIAVTSKQLSVAKSLAMEQSCTVSGCCESRARAAFLTMALAATTWTNQRRA